MESELFVCVVCSAPMPLEALFAHNRKCRMSEQRRRKEVLGWHKFHVLEPPAEDLPVPTATLILPGLWLGSASAVKDEAWVKENGIKAVINAASDVLPPASRSTFDKYLHLQLADTNAQALAPVLPDALALLRRAGPDYPVLVHCAMGVSRSASVVMAHLMASWHCSSLSDAWILVTRCRNVVYPNRGFMAQLRELDEHLHEQAKSRDGAVSRLRASWPTNVIALHADLIGIELSRGAPLTKQQLEDVAEAEARKWRGAWAGLDQELTKPAAPPK